MHNASGGLSSKGRCGSEPAWKLGCAGYEDKELVVECSQSGVLIQSQDSPPLLDRMLEYSVDTTREVEMLRCGPSPLTNRGSGEQRRRRKLGGVLPSPETMPAIR